MRWNFGSRRSLWLALPVYISAFIVGCGSTDEPVTTPGDDTGGASDTAVIGDGDSTDTGTTGDSGSAIDSGTTTDTGIAIDTGGPPFDAGPPGSVPVIGGCAIFPADNPWNTRIDDPSKFKVHGNWSKYQTTMHLTTALHADWGNWSTDKYGIPYATVPATQPPVPITFTYASESDPGPYPIPPTVKIEGGGGTTGDRHILIIETGSCTLYETWASLKTGSTWSAGSGAKFNLKSNALRKDGWTSADAAGLPVLPGLVRIAEVKAGAINHAIRFTMNNTQNAYIHPATHAAGLSGTDFPPLGLRLRLKASFDLTKYTGAPLVILTAMKQYGVILADNGSNWYISGDSDDAWTATLMDSVSAAFGKVTGGDFEAVETGPISTVGL